MGDYHVAIRLAPRGSVEQHAHFSSFQEAMAWLDAQNPDNERRKGHLIGRLTEEQEAALGRKGYGWNGQRRW